MLRRICLGNNIAKRLRCRAFATTLPRLNVDYQMYRTACVREPAPEFAGKAVVNGVIKDINISDYKEIIAFSDRHAEFEKINTQLIAVSCDSVYSHLAWVNTPRKKGGLGEMHIPLLSDKTMEISRDYGVLIESMGVSLRGLFIIDTNGVLRHFSVTDLSVGRDVNEALRVVQSFQYADENGGVIPCGWTPGKPTLDPTKAYEFFEKNM